MKRRRFFGTLLAWFAGLFAAKRAIAADRKPEIRIYSLPVEQVRPLTGELLKIEDDILLKVKITRPGASSAYGFIVPVPKRLASRPSYRKRISEQIDEVVDVIIISQLKACGQWKGVDEFMSE